MLLLAVKDLFWINQIVKKRYISRLKFKIKYNLIELLVFPAFWWIRIKLKNCRKQRYNYFVSIQEICKSVENDWIWSETDKKGKMGSHWPTWLRSRLLSFCLYEIRPWNILNYFQKSNLKIPKNGKNLIFAKDTKLIRNRNISHH